MYHFLEERSIIIGKLVYVRENKTKPHAPGWWSKKKRMEVVTSYLALGSVAETSRFCNVPLATVANWKSQPWWKELVDEIQSGEGQKQDNKMSRLIDKALDILMERIEDGDYQYDQKTGRLVKVPLKARDLERVASGLFDKRQLIRNKPTNIKENAGNQQERLLKLAEQFAQFAGAKIKDEKLIEEYIDEEVVVEQEDGTYAVREELEYGEEMLEEEGEVND